MQDGGGEGHGPSQPHQQIEHNNYVVISLGGEGEMFSEKSALIAALKQVPVHFDVPKVGIHSGDGREGDPGQQKLGVIVGVVGQDGGHQGKAVLYGVEHVRPAEVAVVVAQPHAL